jgi:hypothetical protein
MRSILIIASLGTAAVPVGAQVPYPTVPGTIPQNADALVRSWYQRFLGRDVSPGYYGWVNALNSGSSASTVLSEILGSDEYYVRAGGTPEGFVQALYRDVAGRPPTAPEMRSMLPRVAYGKRNDVAYTLLLRYPQTWSVAAYAAPAYPAPTYPAPVYRPAVERDRRREREHEHPDHWEHDPHEYRRPYWHHHW